MSMNLKDSLVLKQYSSAKTVERFIRNAIDAHNGMPQSALWQLKKLLSVSESARAEVARDAVNKIYYQMRESAVQEATREEREKHQAAVRAKRDAATERYAANAGVYAKITAALRTLSYADLSNLYRLRNSESRTRFYAFCKPLLSENDLKRWGKPPSRTAARNYDNEWELGYDAGLTVWHEAEADRRDRELETNASKAASFDRMVMALDAIRVGGKILGDCTGADLLREAVKLEELAKEATAQSIFYRELATIVGKVTTVREASDRAGIVGLLTHHYSEAVKEAAE